jgi:hypothetical protein
MPRRKEEEEKRKLKGDMFLSVPFSFLSHTIIPK